jgi:hypothetical protein
MDQIASSKMFAGVAMLLMNLGSRYVVSDITAVEERIFKSDLIKPIIVFCMIFIPTRDVMVSIMLTFAYFFVMNNFLQKLHLLISKGQVKTSQESYQNYVSSMKSESSHRSE